ncbi:MAG TPA: type ISP restriction/modification enzyme, partial [Allocoleopsis sp.]
PYSGHSANKNEWIEGLVKDYYQIDGVPLDEKNSKWLQDDYVKFIRFGQYQIDKTKQGILAFITNHGYLDNPTFRGMRQHLMKSFKHIFIVNLHGNIKKKEISADGSPDQNVFDIQQGVSILIAVKDVNFDEIFWKTPNIDVTVENGIFYYDLWGSREDKYKLLSELSFNNIQWEKINPVSPFYLFVPQNADLLEEYNQYEKITDIMPVNVLGFQTHRDDFAIDFDRDKLYQRIAQMRDLNISDQEYLDKYNLKESQNWKISKVRKAIQKDPQWEKPIIDCLYRPFDQRSCYFSSLIMDRPRRELINHLMGKDNLCLGLGRQGIAVNDPIWSLISVSTIPVDANIFRRGGINIFPLYIYPNTQDGQANLITEKEANFSPQFLTKITAKLGDKPSPEKIFYYIYAVFHSPEYRYRYAPFLKIDFPRVPLTSNNEKFTQLAQKGEELVNLHLLKKLPNVSMTKNETLTTVDLPLFSGNQQGKIHYQGDGKNEINQITYSNNLQKITINKDCYFTGITEEVWEFKIGGYQVLDKWLKDRKKANLNLLSDDITHYQKIILALQKTIIIMEEIEQIIGEFPMK